jgi:predicted DCC family thiol-disulfide oxidoreductase YuxK
MPDRPVVVYERSCGFCSWTAGLIMRWDRSHRLRPLALEDPEADVLLSEVDPDVRPQSWHFVARDGSVTSFGVAAAPLLRELPGGSLLAPLVGLAPAFTNRAYRAVAEHRSALSKLVPRASVERARQLLGERAGD